MSQSTEIVAVRQDPDEPPRRMFWSETIDLTVWLNPEDWPMSFQLCYDKGRAERALMWTPERGFLHAAVDDGEAELGFRYKATPLLVGDGHFDARRVAKVFQALSPQLPPEVAAFVTEKLRQHPNYET